MGVHGKRVTVACETCGNPMSLTPSVLRKRGRSGFCSSRCFGETLRRGDKKVSVPCTHCGMSITRLKATVRSANYCSRQCSAADRRKDDARWRDKDQIRAYMRAYVQRNKTAHNLRARLWSAVNRAAKARLLQKRRAAEKVGTLTATQWLRILDKHGRRCVLCGSTERLEIDHIVPLSKGGEHAESNVQPLCRGCNARKGSKPMSSLVSAGTTRSARN